MLTAITKKGKKLCLADEFKRSSLEIFRKREEFFCPVCKEKVILKLGEKRIFHFSHLKDSACTEEYERESEYHLNGKRQLYRWLKKIGLRPAMEQYDAQIRQRPDILFSHRGERFAVEFQCSTISEKLFIKRTTAYFENGYEPIWILGGNQFKRKESNIVSLSAFHYLFLTKNRVIPYFCPDKGMFLSLSNVQNYSPRSAFAHITFQRLDKMELQNLLNPHSHPSFTCKEWLKKLIKYKLGLCNYYPLKGRSFLKILYEKGLNPFLLPPEIGLPIKNSPMIETSPLEWQTYLFIDLFNQKKKGDIISFNEAIQVFTRHCKGSLITLRTVPLISASTPYMAVSDYLETLVKVGVLSSAGTSTYRMERNMETPKTCLEQQEKEVEFYRKFQDVFLWNDENNI